MFDKSLPEPVRDKAMKRLVRRLDFVEAHMAEAHHAGRQYLVGDGFTVADAYCFTILNWAPYVDLDMAPWPALRRYHADVGARPKVREAMRAEGLLD